MKKVRVNISLSEDLREKCEELNINISSFTEIKLREYIAMIEGEKSFHRTPQKKTSGPAGIRTLVTGSEGQTFNSVDLNEYMSILSLSGISKQWLSTIKSTLEEFLHAINYDISNKEQVLHFLSAYQQKYSVSSYRKRLFQIKKFMNHYHQEWVSSIKPPKEPHYQSKYVSDNDVDRLLEYFNGKNQQKRYRAFIKLGIDGGIRAEELYQLRPEDIDVENRIVHINHCPEKNQTTKMKQSRITFFTEDTKREVISYLQEFNNGSGLKRLFEKYGMTDEFRNAPLQAKMLRKYFSQRWTRCNGNTAVKKILMGHSTRNDVDLQHYNAQSTDDLKTVYDNVMSSQHPR